MTARVLVLYLGLLCGRIRMYLWDRIKKEKGITNISRNNFFSTLVSNRTIKVEEFFVTRVGSVITFKTTYEASRNENSHGGCSFESILILKFPIQKRILRKTNRI